MRRAATDVVLAGSGLAKRYTQGKKHVLALGGVDLAVRKGEFVVVTGPSGSGKSTLLHIVGGLDRPDDGEVLLEGISMSRFDDDALAAIRRRRLGFVLQFFNLLPTLSAIENVALPLVLDGVKRPSLRAREMLDRVGLAERETHLPWELSGGEQQRVALARALVADPAIVLADEPTGNLDSATGSHILALLRATADEGQAVLLVTHDSKAANWADHVVDLADGRVVSETSLRAGIT